MANVTRPPLKHNTTTLVPFISLHTRIIFDIINYVTLCGAISLFGCVTNIINIVIFYKQGLNTTINISFFGLAISDFCSLITISLTGINMNPLLVHTDFPMDGSDAEYLIGSWPHACFAHITCWIIAYITVERYLCIASPLKVKQIITPFRTTVIISFMYVINLLPYFLEVSSAYLDWAFVPERNRTLLVLTYRENRRTLEGLAFIFLGLFGILTFPVVIIFTALLVAKLRRQAEWRQKTTRAVRQTDMTSKREIKTMNMVVFISGILIVCYIPSVIASMTSFLVPGFHLEGHLENIFFVVWSFVDVFEAFNSSINIFFYYKMSSRFKITFLEVFSACSRGKSRSILDKDTTEVDD